MEKNLKEREESRVLVFLKKGLIEESSMRPGPELSQI